MEVKPGHKKTEIGVIPEEWRVSRFGDLCAVYRGGSPRPIQNYITDSPDGVNWIKIGDIGVGAKYIDSTAERIIAAGVSRSRQVKVGDFLLSNSMSFGRPYILRTEGCIHDGWLVIQAYQRAFDTEFLYYYLSSEAVVAQYTRYAAGSSVLNLNKQLVSSILVAAPPAAEQRAIAAALSDVDALLAKLEQLIAKKRDLKQAAMQLLLPGHRRLPGHAEPWLRVQLGDLFDFRNGVNAEKRAYGRGIQFINVLEVITRPHLTAEHVPGRVLLARGVQENFSVRRGDVLFNRTSETQGEVALASAYIDDAPMVFGGFVIRGRPKAQRLDALYAGYGLRAPEVRQQLVARGQGAIRSNVGQAELSAVEVRLPCVREQQAIAAVLSDMDTELTALEARREKTRQLKQGMMQALLTGRIRLV